MTDSFGWLGSSHPSCKGGRILVARFILPVRFISRLWSGFFRGLFILLSFWFVSVHAADNDLYRTIITKNGSEVAEYRGIRFAESPEKHRRWKPPRGVGALQVLNEWPPICIQDEGNRQWYQAVALGVGAAKSVIPATPESSEDCLFLNLWRPLNSESENLPVMVWIHGGGNVGGWSFEPNYRGPELAAGGVIVVSIAYRLGVFGFLAHPDLTRETSYASSGNYGLLDQLEALRWVQAHIEKFGGDRSNVTVFGESAGAGNIGYLLASPMADGLFHKAVMQSGGWSVRQNRTLEQDEGDGQTFTENAHVTLAELRNLTALELVELAQQHYTRGYSALQYDPPIDGWFLPAAPSLLYARRDRPRRPVLMGTNENENLMYLPSSTKSDWEAALQKIDKESHRAIEAHLKPLSFRQKLDALTTAQDYLCDSIATADALAKQGSPVFFYRFRQVREKADRLGAYHGAEIPYVFDSHDQWLPTSSLDRALTAAMKSKWITFAKTGRPDDGDDWPAWSSERHAAFFQDPVSYGVIDTTLCGLIGSD